MGTQIGCYAGSASREYEDERHLIGLVAVFPSKK
jgi:hypothetical protein